MTEPLNILLILQDLFNTYQTFFVALQFFYLTTLFLTHNTRFQLIGLTGGIATGKSTVSQHLTTPPHHLTLVDFDHLSKTLTATTSNRNSPLLTAIRTEFGDSVFTSDGTLDRTALGNIVWDNKTKRNRLNQLYRWPLIRAWVSEVMRCGWVRRGGVVVLDVPLLYESGMWVVCRETVCVSCDESTQLKRLMARDAIDEVLARSKVASQMSMADKRRRSDVVIDNSGTVEELRAKVDEWVRWRRERAPTWREWLTPSLPCVVVSLLLWLPVWIAYGSWLLMQPLHSK